MIFLNLIRIGIFTTIANQNCLSQSLVHSMTQNLPLICHDVKIGNVQNVIAVDGILHMDSLSIVGTAQQLDLLNVLFIVALLITNGLQFGLTSICTAGTNTSIRRLMNAINNTGNPSVIRIQNLGLNGINQLILRQKFFHGFIIESVMLQIVLSLINLTSLLETTNIRLLSQLQNLIHSRVSQNFTHFPLIIVKYIVLHFVILLVVIIIIIANAGIFQYLTDQCINGSHLLF